jgi:hypothetical protein
MRDEDFPKKIKDKALKRSKFKCERCWSSRNLVYHHRIPVSRGGASLLDNCIVLCSNCHSIAPEGELALKLFIEFASPKEMIKHYGVKTELEAIERWCNENGVCPSEVIRKFKTGSHKISVLSGMERKALKGEMYGFPAPFGYIFDSGNLEIVEKEARIVEKIFSQYTDCCTLLEIANNLNFDGIKTKKNSKWSIWSVRRILKNPIYAGYVKWNNIVKKGRHPPIIDLKQFNQVQKKMEKRSIRKPKSSLVINDGGPSLR